MVSMSALASRVYRPVSFLTLFIALSLMAVSAGHAAPIMYTAILNGTNEFPSNASPGTGTGLIETDAVAHTMKVHVDFTGLLGNTTASHIHAPTAVALTGTAGVATTTPTFAGFPTGVTSGTYDALLDMTQASSYNPSYITANGGTTASAEAALFQAIADGKAYLNIHSTSFTGGEIRGFLVLTSTPTTPATWGRVKALYH
jgi:hypothetical protein